MANDDEITIKIRIAQAQAAADDARKVEKSLKDVGSEVDRVDRRSRLASMASGGIGMLGRGLLFAGKTAVYTGTALAAAAVIMGGKAVQAASSLNETLNQTTQVFGKQAPILKAWSQDSAMAIGMSQDQALTAADNYGYFFKNLGATEKAASAMSKQLVITASDMASFKDATPQQMLDAVASAMAGEYDPLQRYGFAITAAAVQHEALRLGLAATTKELSQQDTAIAAYSLVLKNTGAAAGDFQRTVGTSLADQERRFTGLWGNLKAKVGQVFLPAVLSATAALNEKLMPALSDLVDKYGPRVAAWVTKFATTDAPKLIGWLRDAGERYGPKVVGFFRDWRAHLPDGATMHQVGAAFASIGSSLAKMSGGAGSGAANTMTVASKAMAVLADHADQLGWILPAVAVGWGALKVAQAGANVSSLLGIPLKVAEIVAMHRHTAALNTNSAALGGHAGASLADAAASGTETAATSANTAATGRNRVAVLLTSAAQKVWAVTTGVLSIALRGMGFAMRFAMGPLGIAITIIGLLAAGLIYAYKHSEKFRAGVDFVARAVVGYYKFMFHGAAVVFGWIKKHWPLLLGILTGPIGIAVYMIVKHFDGIKSAFKGLINFLIRGWNALDWTIDIPDWMSKVPGFPDGAAGHRVDLIPDIPLLAAGGTATAAGVAVVGDAGPELISMPRGASITPLKDPAGIDLKDLGRRGPIAVSVYLDGRQIQRSVQEHEEDRLARL